MMRLIDADELRGLAIPCEFRLGALTDLGVPLYQIDNAPTVEITEEQAIDKLHETGWLPLHDKEMTERPHEWIPVNERIPEGKIDPMTNDFELVLCSTVWEVVRPYKFGKPIGHSKAHFWSGGGIMDDYVIAWQPLPEPYKEETEK